MGDIAGVTPLQAKVARLMMLRDKALSSGEFEAAAEYEERIEILKKGTRDER